MMREKKAWSVFKLTLTRCILTAGPLQERPSPIQRTGIAHLILAQPSDQDDDDTLLRFAMTVTVTSMRSIQAQ